MYARTLTSQNKCAPSPWVVEQNSTTLEWMVKMAHVRSLNAKLRRNERLK
jgi:hypothetical protein